MLVSVLSAVHVFHYCKTVRISAEENWTSLILFLIRNPPAGILYSKHNVYFNWVNCIHVHVHIYTCTHMYVHVLQYTVYLNLNFYIWNLKKKLIKKGKLTISEYMYMYFILTHPILHVAKRAIASVGNVVGIFGAGDSRNAFFSNYHFFFSVFFFSNKYVPKIAFFQRQKFAYSYYL